MKPQGATPHRLTTRSDSSQRRITVINYNNPTFNMNYSENIDVINSGHNVVSNSQASISK